MIVAENLSRNYGDFVAVEDVSFTISRGEVVGLLGHNGAGKTTIMKMLTGYLEPTSGEILIDGRRIEEHRLDIQRQIGYLPENCPLYPDMTVVQYLEYVSNLRGLPADRCASAINSVIEKTSLQEKALEPIDTLSRGYRQRAGVAQAIIHDPDILILDEPTNGLDPSQIHEMRSLIEELSKHATVIISTHILQEVEAVCDRAIIVLNGQIARDAKLEELRTSNRLVISVNQDSNIATPVLKSVEGVNAIQPPSNGEGRYEYILEVDSDEPGVASRVAKAVVEKGWDLYNLNRERRNLESVFREINS